MSNDDLLTCEQLAARWKVHEGTIRNWVSNGRIPGTTEPLPYMKIGQAVRFSAEQVEFIESRMVRVKRAKRRRSGAA